MYVIWAGGNVRGEDARHLRHRHPARGVQHVQVNQCMPAPNPSMQGYLAHKKTPPPRTLQ